MIIGYRDKKTEAFARGEFVKDFQGFEGQASRRLSILNAAPDLASLRALPSNRLEALRGDRIGQFSIRVNQQWRICFEWRDGQPGLALLVALLEELELQPPHPLDVLRKGRRRVAQVRKLPPNPHNSY